MFGFIEKIFLTGLTVLSCVNSLSATPLSCISMNNQSCKVRPEIINVNSDEPIFYPFSKKQVNAVITVTTSMIYMQKYVFLILQKIYMLNY